MPNVIGFLQRKINSSSWLTGRNVVCVDGDVGVAVVSALFVPETKRVHQLMHDDSLVLAARAQRQLLCASNSSNSRMAPVKLYLDQPV